MHRWVSPVFAAGALAAACASDAPPHRVFDCPTLADTYATSCGDHLGISDDTSACALVQSRQGSGLQTTIDRAAIVCEAAAADPSALELCDRIFVCVADSEGLSALTMTAHVSGSATVKGVTTPFDTSLGWAWLGTKPSGKPGDFAALFSVAGRPWYFKLDDLAVRARTKPFAVDAARPIKLESGDHNIELASGEVTIAAFAVAGAFDIEASGSDTATGEAISIHLVGSFAEPLE
ncbi:MAG: hypothetical protein U1F43_17115 [Myxococcota bacterium]